MIAQWLLLMAFFISTMAICAAQGGPPLRTDDPGTTAARGRGFTKRRCWTSITGSASAYS